MGAEIPSRKRTVFLVDDHPLVREWLTNLIQQQPDLAVCGEAESGPQALQSILAIKPQIAIVDISLKDSSGMELIKNLKQCCPGIAILVLSMHEESHYAERALRAGARGYIIKRETSRKVIAAIRQVLEGKMYVSQDIATAMAAHFVQGRSLSAESPAELLSDRELEVFQFLGQGRGTRQISELLRVSVRRCKRTARELRKNSTSPAPPNWCVKQCVGRRARARVDPAVWS